MATNILGSQIFPFDLGRLIKRDDLKVVSLFGFFFFFLYFYTKVSRAFYSEIESRSWNVWVYEGRISFDTFFVVILALSLLTLVISFLGAGIKKQDLPKMVYVPFISISLLFGVISVFHYIPYPLGADIAKDKIYILSVIMAWVSLASSIISIWRPAFALNSFILWFLLAQNSYVLLGFLPRSHTDWGSIAEFGVILAAFVILLDWIEKNKFFSYQGKKPFADLFYLKGEGKDHIHGYRPIEILFFFLLGLHFANYFWSGLEKLISLGSPTAAWIYADPLYVYIPYMHIYDRISAAVPAGLEQFYFTLVKNFTPAFLISSLSVQLISIAVIFHRKLMAVLPFLLDIFHSFVFLMAGILFYKWMVFNMALSYVFSSEKRHIPRSVQIIFVLICISPFMAGPLKLYKLAWYDMFQFNAYHTAAILDDGEKVTVPSNFFLNKSLTFSSIGTMNTFEKRFSDIGSWGGATYDMVQRTRQCDETLLTTIDSELIKTEQERMTNFFRQHHLYMVNQYNNKGKLPHFNLYPHHSFSDPRQANKLRDIDFNRVVAYELSGTQGCVDPDIIDPRTPPHIVHQETWRIDVSDM